MNLAMAYEEKGGLLSVDNLFDSQYWEMSCCSFWMTGSAALEDILYMRGYLLNVSAMRTYSFLLKVKKSVARSCQGPSGTSLGSMDWIAWVALCCMQILHLFTVCDINFHSGSIDSCLC